MTNIYNIPTDHVLVAIDIAKLRHEILIAFPGKKRRKRLTILSNKQDMLALGQSQRFYDPLVENINDIQELSKTHEVVSKSKTEIWHRILTHYLPLYFPEAERFKNRTRSG